MKRTVLIGFLGTTLDKGIGAKRWDKWRPTIDLVRQEDMLVDRFELFCDLNHQTLANVIQKDIAQVSPDTRVNLHNLSIKDPWDFEEVFSHLFDFASQYNFDPEKEDYLFHITTGTHVCQICTFLLTESRHFPGKMIQCHPSWKQGGKPGSYTIIDLDLSRYDSLAQRFEQDRSIATSYLKSGIETMNPTFNALIERMEQVALRSKDPVLLMGPTGAGKSQLAKRLYELKKDRHQISGSLVEINCATIKGENAMSALFGHRKGSFTGALQDRPGLLKTAHQGVLFLDEIGELGLDEQAMLLRALEEKQFLPFGADREESSDFQLIAGTNRDLFELVQKGEFREDLLARINLWTFEIPGLKDRKEDIEPNLIYELSKYTLENGARVQFNREASNAFLKFAVSPGASWSANFRDLNAAITRMATLSNGGRISLNEVQDEIKRLKRSWQPMDTNGTSNLTKYFSEAQMEEIDEFDQGTLRAVIRVCENSKSLAQAGKTLFQASRKKKKTSNDSDRLRKFLAKFDLRFEDFHQ